MLAFLFSFLFLFQVFQSKPDHSILTIDGQNFDNYIFDANISKVIQDKRGLLWLGTNNGVISYDGYVSNYYSTSLLDTASLGFYGDYVNSLYEDSKGNIWAATAYGTWNVLPLNSTSFINAHKTHDERLTNVRAIIELDNGTIFSNSNVGFHFLSYDSESNSITNKTIEYESIGIDDPINNVVKTQDGEILLINDGVYQITISDDYEIDVIKKIDGDLNWHLAEIEAGVYLFNDGSNVNVGFPDGSKLEINIDVISEDYILSIHKDSKGKIWIGTNKQLMSFHLTSDFEVRDLRTFQIQNTRSILEDQSGNLFFGHQQGLLKLNWNYTDYTYIDLPEKYGDTYTYKFHTDINGNYWISHEYGFLKYMSKTGEFVEIQTDNRVNSINEDEDNNIWTGDRGSLKIYDPSTNDVIQDFKNGHTYSIYFQKNGDAWFINKGLIKRVKKGTTLIEDVGIDNTIRRFHLDGSIIWLHSNEFNLRKYQINDSGLVLIDEYLTDKPEYQFNWFEDDRYGNIWMSSRKGVLIVSKKTGEIVSIFNRENKLNGDEVFELIRDQRGIIWVKAASFGSTAIDPKTFESVSFTPSWLTQPNSKGYYCVNAVGRNGELFTDGRGGFFVFHPDSIKKSETTPNISLLNTKVNDVDYDPNASSLKYFQNDVDFEYTGVHLDNPDRNEFAYFLEGYDEDWNQVGSERVARYLSLPSGSYIFYVKASNSDLVWSEPVALASFRILPPWWANPIAYSIYLLVFGLIAFRFYQIQLNKKVAESEAERLKEVDEFKTRFFTNISHEFRTPLTVIMGLADRIQHESSPIIKRNASKLLELINQILELSKLEANNGNLKLNQGDIVAYINYLCQSYSSFAEENRINLLVESDDDQIIMDFDKDKIDLIVQNIVSNAIKFTNQGGSINIFISRNSKQLLIEISDTGRGISEDELPKIFDRFYQVETAYSNHQGSGIGLSLTRELVHLMKGEISVESKIGKGTTFTLNLPITQNEEVEAIDFSQISNIEFDKRASINREEFEGEMSDKNLVLLIEDNEDVRDFVYSVISKDFDVITAKDGKEGIELALDKIPDMIVSDVMMPEKNGIEVTQILKSDAKTSHIPIILLTAKADIESKLVGLKTGADIYLAKPFNESELQLHLNNLLAQRERIRAKYNATEEVEKTEDEFIVKVRELLMQQLDDEDFGINEICREIGASRTQLHRKLKALTGKSTSIFIRDIRLKEAQKLLRTTSHPISEVAYQVGFGDPNYFSKLYSEKYSYSPSKERE